MYGDRANPKYWERVVKQHRIRLNLGHLVNDAKLFYDAVMKGADRTNVWSLDAPLRMFDRRQADPPDVYGDLAYMPELNDKDDCAKFFAALAKAFTPGDPKLERILFGTDWIMYGREPRSDRFLGNVEQGMRDARYSGEQIGNILWDNAQRFLGPAA
jgi:predicted TIM-barrel fold metal-dependent hydrolase